jgi:transcriptional regulator with XRE-family HTH domain
MKKNDYLRKLYVEKGLTIRQVAEEAGLSYSSVQRYKKIDKDNGLDWDDLRLQKHLSQKEFENRKKLFLIAIFDSFMKAKEQLDSVEDPIQKIELIDKFTNSYYKVTLTAKRDDPEIVILDLVTEIISILSNIAKKKDRPEIIKFFLDHTEDIKNEVQKKFN